MQRSSKWPRTDRRIGCVFAICTVCPVIHRRTRPTSLPGELILAIVVPASTAARRSTYLKVRDRASFEFALVSTAVAMEVRDGAIIDAGIAAGGVGTKPWPLPEVESALRGGR